jgi:RND family efflux transporter MFP subunit
MITTLNDYKKMRTQSLLKLTPIVALAVMISCSSGANSGTDTAAAGTETVREKPKVKIESVNAEDVEQLSEFTASVQAEVSNRIAPQTPVRIQQLHVEVGDRVSKGQLLATMDDTNLKQSKIQIDNQETEFKRIDELYKVGGVSKSVWDAQKTGLDVAKETYRNLRENNQLMSPIAGIVTARNYDNGDMYSGQQPVYVVQQIRPVKLRVNVSEAFYTQVKKGMEVRVRLDVYGEEEFRGRVSLIYPTIDEATRTFPVELRIDNSDERVRPGMFARVTMNFGTLSHIVVPDQAIVKQIGSGDRYIYVYDNGKVSYQKVELGRRMGNRYEVLSGVESGDQVVVVGQSRLMEGTEVDVVQ